MPPVSGKQTGSSVCPYSLSQALMSASSVSVGLPLRFLHQTQRQMFSWDLVEWRAGLHQANAVFAVDNRGNAVVGADFQKFRLELLVLANVEQREIRLAMLAGGYELLPLIGKAP